MQRPVDQCVADALLGQPLTQQGQFKVVIVEVSLITEVIVVQALAEQCDDAGLGAFFDLADGSHSFSWLVSMF
jgi:hypothetical protein